MKRLLFLTACLLFLGAAFTQYEGRLAPERTPKLTHLHITVSDLERSVRFYRDTLGLRLLMQQADFAYFDVGDNKMLFLDAAKGGRRVSPEGTTLGFATHSVDEQYELLKARGVRPFEPPKNRPYGARSFYFFDPDGYTIEYEQALRGR